MKTGRSEMTRAEEKAFHRGKLAAFVDARDRHLGKQRRCEFRNPGLRQRWHEGYAEQVSASQGRKTVAQEANIQGWREVIADWLAKHR